MASIEAELLFQLEMRITGVDSVGVTARGTRVIAHVKGGFDGPGLKGTVEDGDDWFVLRRDGVGELDVRLTLKTDGGEYIYMHYTGIAEIPQAAIDAAGPGQLPSGKFKLRTAVNLETGSERHARLNRVQAVGVGASDTSAGTVSYKIYALS